jgi:hypothetical protein
MSLYTLPRPRRIIDLPKPASILAGRGGGLDTVFHKFLQFDSIIAFMRYIDALEFMHVYASGGRNDNFSFHLGHRILHERLRKTRVQNGYGELQGQSLRQESSPPSACARVVHRRAAEQ